jgi:hypothetical protein
MAIPTQVLLINGDYIRQYTELNKSVEEGYIRSSVRKAQDIELQPLLGTDLYNKILSDTEDASISGVYLTLKDTYIKPCLVEWAMYYLIPILDVKIDNGGLVQRISENTTPATSTVVNRLMDHHLASAKFYAQRMVNYICENSSLFPEYSTNNDNQLWPMGNKVAGFGVVGSNPNRNNLPGELQKWPYRINP